MRSFAEGVVVSVFGFHRDSNRTSVTNGGVATSYVFDSQGRLSGTTTPGGMRSFDGDFYPGPSHLIHFEQFVTD